MKKTAAALGITTVLALLGPLTGSAPSATAAEQETTIKPQRLPRGADVAVPHLVGRTVVDGDIRVRVRAERAHLLGPAGDGYVVDTVRNGKHRTVRVAPGSPPRTLMRGTHDQVLLSDDGATLAVIQDLDRRAALDIRSADDGSLLASRTFRTYPRLLDVDGDHVVVASFDRGAVDFNWREGTRERITPMPAYAADLGSNRLAYFTSDPYDGGCSQVAPLHRPQRVLWRSCDERVAAFSPTGRRIITVHLLADGIGPNQVWERSDRGRLFGSYRVGSFFGSLSWESSTDLLLEAYGPRRGAVARCSEGECQRATELSATPRY